MNILKRWKATTPKRYKKWGKIMKNISYSLGVGMAGVATLQLPMIIITIIGVIIIITGSISAFCYAQIEDSGDTKSKRIRKDK